MTIDTQSCSAAYSYLTLSAGSGVATRASHLNVLQQLCEARCRHLVDATQHDGSRII
eukprot:m.904045 g.904045  ORF g.904045 m.904045 type:complete len:57 (-) comp23694_c0_seq58:2151-2321(-)